MSGPRVIRLSERLSYWAERHPEWRPNPEWPEEVGCVLYSAAEAVVLIDPLVRDDLDPTAWEWLDTRVSAANIPVAVLLTAPWHERSTRSVVDRYGARVWIDPVAQARVSDLPRLQAVPAGIEVFTPRGVSEGQVAFYIAPEQTLVVAEFFPGTTEGLRVCPSPGTRDMAEFAQSLTELKRLSVERILVAHGPPVLSGGKAAIAAALRSFAGTRK